MPSVKQYSVGPVLGHYSVNMPAGAEILSAKEHGDQIAVWAKIDATQSMTERRVFHLVGTNTEMPDNPNLRFVGTAVLPASGLVVHVFFDPFAQ